MQPPAKAVLQAQLLNCYVVPQPQKESCSSLRFLGSEPTFQKYICCRRAIKPPLGYLVVVLQNTLLPSVKLYFFLTGKAAAQFLPGSFSPSPPQD